jgi:hypothetical protein
MEQLERVVKLCIHMGISPKEMYLSVFNIIDKEIDAGEFLKEKQCNKNDREIYEYIILYADSLNLSIDEALKRASGDYCKLDVKVIPKHRKYIIREYDGFENVEILQDFMQ